MTRPIGVANGVTRQAVLNLLAQEADMDGVAIVSLAEIGRALGFSRETAYVHIQHLIADALIAHDDEARHEVDRFSGVAAYRLAESVTA